MHSLSIRALWLAVILVAPGCFISIDEVNETPVDGDGDASVPGDGDGSPESTGGNAGDGDGDNDTGGTSGDGDTGGTSGDGDTGGDSGDGDGDPATGGSANLCGNNEVDEGEDCDEGGVDTATCDEDCTFVECGDLHINGAAGEECDTENANESCWQCDQPTPGCPNGCVCEFREGHGRYYAFCHGPGFPYDTVVSNCRSTGYEVASLETADEAVFVNNRAAAHMIDIHYVSGRDVVKDGDWVWQTGELFAINTNAQNGLYVNWTSGEPSGSTAENCMEVITAVSTWNDVGCDQFRDVVCEYAPPR